MACARSSAPNRQQGRVLGLFLVVRLRLYALFFFFTFSFFSSLRFARKAKFIDNFVVTAPIIKHIYTHIYMYSGEYKPDFTATTLQQRTCSLCRMTMSAFLSNTVTLKVLTKSLSNFSTIFWPSTLL